MAKTLRTIGVWSVLVIVLTTFLSISSSGFASSVEQPFTEYEMTMNQLEIDMIKENIRLWK